MKKCKGCGILCTVLKVLLAVGGVLFTIYMFNLDMKLVGWLYTVLNKFHDRKPRDIRF